MLWFNETLICSDIPRDVSPPAGSRELCSLQHGPSSAAVHDARGRAAGSRARRGGPVLQEGSQRCSGQHQQEGKVEVSLRMAVL